MKSANTTSVLYHPLFLIARALTLNKFLDWQVLLKIVRRLQALNSGLLLCHDPTMLTTVN